MSCHLVTILAIHYIPSLDSTKKTMKRDETKFLDKKRPATASLFKGLKMSNNALKAVPMQKCQKNLVKTHE